MKSPLIWLLGFSLLLSACSKNDDATLAAFDVYCEMVASQAKPVALHQPMPEEEVDRLWPEFEKIARKHQVQWHREQNFPATLLFPISATMDKTVVVIYRKNSLTQYQQLKKDIDADTGNDLNKSIALARRFGRLLGYDSQGINELLSYNTPYRNIEQAGVRTQITHLYYKDLAAAINFYGTTLGLKKADSTTFYISQHALISLHPQDEALHPEGQPKSTAIAFLTDQLSEWYTYAQSKKIPIKYTYKPREGGPHDGFVAIDPEGYLLEFEKFKQHPENEVLMSILENTERLKTAVNDLSFFGSITWTYHKDVLKMQNFYQDVLGYRLVADQGWTKIFQTSESGFIGLVDERRGMEDYADTKAVEITWQVEHIDSFQNYAQAYWEAYDYTSGAFTGPEGYRYSVYEAFRAD